VGQVAGLPWWYVRRGRSPTCPASAYWYDSVREVRLDPSASPRSRPDAVNVVKLLVSPTLRVPLALAGRYNNTGAGTLNDPADIGD